MQEIICPNCKKAFILDDSGYADILRQVRDEAFDKALRDRLELAEKEKISAVRLAEAEVAKALTDTAAKKDA